VSEVQRSVRELGFSCCEKLVAEATGPVREPRGSRTLAVESSYQAAVSEDTAD
jgi:hypothetical protein